MRGSGEVILSGSTILVTSHGDATNLVASNATVTITDLVLINRSDGGLAICDTRIGRAMSRDQTVPAATSYPAPDSSWRGRAQRTPLPNARRRATATQGYKEAPPLLGQQLPR